MRSADSQQLSRVLDVVAQLDPGRVIAVALVGSAADGGLRPDSDLDLLVLTGGSLTVPERRLIVDGLLRISGSRATVTPGRPVELMSLNLEDITPWRYPATCDFLYGEWLRSDYEAGRLPAPELDPNLPVTLTSARDHAIQLSGPPVRDLLERVPPHHLFRSLHDALPALMANLAGDERNVLLTLARMVVTLETGTIVPKDHAAIRVAATLSALPRQALVRAADGYLGTASDDWTTHDAPATASVMTQRISTHSDGSPGKP